MTPVDQSKYGILFRGTTIINNVHTLISQFTQIYTPNQWKYFGWAIKEDTRNIEETLQKLDLKSTRKIPIGKEELSVNPERRMEEKEDPKLGDNIGKTSVDIPKLQEKISSVSQKCMNSG